MANEWKQTGVRGELTNDRVFVEHEGTGQTGSVVTSVTSDKGVRDQQVGEAIAAGKIDGLTPPRK